MKKVLILAPYPMGEAPSQRFRFEHFLPFFNEFNLDYTFQSFWMPGAWKILYLKGHVIQKLWYLFFGFLSRFKTLLMLHRYQFIFIHREVAPVGPPFFEFLISKICGKKIIYDFDDAIWLPNTSASNSISAGLKFHRKVAYICKMSWKVSVGNKFLKQYALKYNDKVIINPTVVDTENHHFKLKKHIPVRMPVIGWTGTHSTSHYLKKMELAFLELKKEMDFKLVIISNQPPELTNIDFEFIPWQKENEIDQLLTFDIGIMPLEDNNWEEGKCGFKIIQYFSLGIPAVASPVGVNKELIDQEVNGYLAASKNEWKDALRKLLERHNLRAEMGKNGRDKIVNHYSVLRNKDLYFSSFE